MKKFFVVFCTAVLMFMLPISSHTHASGAFSSVIDSNNPDIATFEFEGVQFTLTLHTNNGVQEAVISDGKKVETVSYDSNKDQLRFNNELVSDEDLQSMKAMVNNSIIEDASDDGVYEIQSIPWKLVKTNVGSINITVASVLFVTGLILLIPTGTGAIAGAVLTAKVIAVLASAIVSSVKSSGHKVVYWKFQTYYKAEGGYWKNKFVLSAYKDSKRTKLIKKVSHETRFGKKYNVYDFRLETPSIFNRILYT